MIEGHGETCLQKHNQTCGNRSQPSTPTSIQQALITCRQTEHSGSNAMLYVFEDNEAVIKMIIKGRSPTMRHVSRTPRIALDWLFDRINFDSKIQIRYIDTKHQLADILTKGNFTRYEWNILLHLFNISHFSSTCCAENSSLLSCPSTMAKRMQEQKEEEIIVAKSKPSAMNLSSSIATSSSSATSPMTCKSPRMPTASGKPDSRMRINPNSYSPSYGSSLLESQGNPWTKSWRQYG